jgi:GAF domain-containing protein
MSSEDSVIGDPLAVLAHGLAEAAKTVFAAGGTEAALSRVLDLCVATIEGCDLAGVVMADVARYPATMVTDPLAAQLAAGQRRWAESPSLVVINQAVSCYAEDLAQDPRWPGFGLEAARLGVRSVLSIPLFAPEALGVLEIYGRSAYAFEAVERAKGLLLGVLAGLAFTSARTHEDDERRAANLHAALATREIIGQAQGILIERERITADQAFDVLRRASQHLNVKLRDVAQTLVDTGEAPATGGHSPSRAGPRPPRW